MNQTSTSPPPPLFLLYGSVQIGYPVMEFRLQIDNLLENLFVNKCSVYFTVVTISAIMLKALFLVAATSQRSWIADYAT